MKYRLCALCFTCVRAAVAPWLALQRAHFLDGFYVVSSRRAVQQVHNVAPEAGGVGGLQPLGRDRHQPACGKAESSDLRMPGIKKCDVPRPLQQPASSVPSIMQASRQARCVHQRPKAQAKDAWRCLNGTCTHCRCSCT